MTSLEPEPNDADPGPTIDPNAHAALQLENALLKAGVDLESPQGKLVQRAWEGKDVDSAAIAAEWEAVKPTIEAPTPPEPEPRVDGEDGQAAERRSLAANAVVEPNPMDRDPREAAIEAGRNALSGANAGTYEDSAAAAIHVLGEALDRGDQRVLVDTSYYADVPNRESV